MSRIPAPEIEKTVCNTINQNLIDTLKLDAIKDNKIIDYINSSTLSLEELVKNCVNKVEVSDGNLEVEINTLNLRSTLKGQLELT